tara:strand:- start:646 stop:1218 length:573 start_codon:yes stop_codon:yes gene_type:complete
MAFTTVVPTADGTTNNWSPISTHYTMLDEGSGAINTNVGEYVFTTSSFRTELFHFAHPSVIQANDTINYVRLAIHAKEGGSAQITPLAHDGSSSYTGTTINLTTTWTSYYETWGNNPATSAAWTIDEVNAFQFGGLSVIAMGRNTAYIAALWLIINYTEAYNNDANGVSTETIRTINGINADDISKVNGV